MLALAAILRVRLAAATPLWFDEIYTLWVSRLPTELLLSTVSRDIHPPLHYLLVSGWRALGGESDLWLKSLSILFGLGSIVVGWATARRLAGPLAGFAAAALFAVHRTHAAFSQESRSFVLLWLLLSASALLAMRWVSERRARDAALWAAVSAAALYTHYLAGLVLAFQFAWGVFALRRDQRPLLAWTGLHAIVAALFVPQLRVLAQQAARLGADHWVRPPAPEDALNLLRQVSFGANYLIPLVLALALLPLLRGARRREAALLALTTLPVIALCYALSMSRGGLFVERYMYFALPGLLILAAAGIARLAELPGVAHRTLAFVRAAVLVALLALGLRSLLLKPVHEEARQLELAARWLDAHASRADLVLHSETHGLFYFRHYRPALGQHVVLMTRERIPYYDGDLLIPDAWRWPLESPIPGARWWGVVNGTSGIDVREARAWIAQGREPLARFGRVEIWAGAGSPNDSTECSAR